MVAACTLWEEVLRDHPTDLLALKFAHDAYFYLGDQHGKRDSVARVLPKWSARIPCYSYLKGMHAFGLEECGDYEKSEQEAREVCAYKWQTNIMRRGSRLSRCNDTTPGQLTQSPIAWR